MEIWEGTGAGRREGGKRRDERRDGFRSAASFWTISELDFSEELVLGNLEVKHQSSQEN